MTGSIITRNGSAFDFLLDAMHGLEFTIKNEAVPRTPFDTCEGEFGCEAQIAVTTAFASITDAPRTFNFWEHTCEVGHRWYQV